MPASSVLIRHRLRLASSTARAGLVLAAALALAHAPALADRNDRYQPLHFAADAARVDDAQGMNVLSGNVEITKGTIVLRSDRVEVRQQADGTQAAVAIGGDDGRAYFRQRREGLDQYIEGEAQRVEYDGRADVVRFVGRAVMRRLEGATVADEVVGQTIVYDNKTEVFQVVGGPGSASSGGRVRGVIAPSRKEGVQSGAATPSDGGTQLSTSGTLSPPDLQGSRR